MASISSKSCPQGGAPDPAEHQIARELRALYGKHARFERLMLDFDRLAPAAHLSVEHTTNLRKLLEKEIKRESQEFSDHRRDQPLVITLVSELGREIAHYGKLPAGVRDAFVEFAIKTFVTALSKSTTGENMEDLIWSLSRKFIGSPAGERLHACEYFVTPLPLEPGP